MSSQGETMKHYLLILILISSITAFGRYFSSHDFTYFISTSTPGDNCNRDDLDCNDVCIVKASIDGSRNTNKLKCFNKVKPSETSIAINKLRARLRNRNFSQDEQKAFEKTLSNAPSIVGFSNAVIDMFTETICHDLNEDIQRIHKEYNELSCGNIVNQIHNPINPIVPVITQ